MTVPRVPVPEGVQQLASDLWWSWNPAARDVFRRLDYTLWRQTDHNPVKMLRSIAPERLEKAARDPNFLESYDKAIEQLNRAQSGTGTWWAQRYPTLSGISIAYFSAELASINRYPCTQEAWEFWQATTAKKPAIWEYL